MKYRTIVVDPPWQYRQNLANGALQIPDGKRGGKQIRGAALHYDVASVDEIAAFPLGDWAEDEAHLYVWVTNAFIEDWRKVKNMSERADS